MRSVNAPFTFCRFHVLEMVCLWIETDAGSALAMGRLFERFGCRVLDRGDDRVRVGFPDASSETEAIAEARLYLSLRPRATRAPFRLAGATPA